MSLISELNKHDENPGKHWGRYSFRADCNKSPDSSETGPENDDVCLISPSSSQKARRPKSTGLGLRPSTKRHFIPKPYEIKDDPVDVVKPCSATDKNPKEFHAKNSKFVIPKTKKETRSDNSLSASCITSEKRHMTRQQRTNTRKFYGLPLVNGVSKPTRNSNDAETRSITLNRPWNHASPKRSGATRASSSALSRLKHDYTDTTNDTSVDNENQYTRSCHGESSAGEHLCLQTEAKDTRVQEHQCILHTVDIEDYQDGKDHIRELPLARNSSSENKPSLVTQADLFCPLCNGQMTQHGCLTCPKTNKSIKADDSAEEAQCKAASFISANNGPPKKILTYSSDKPVRKKKNRSNKAKTSSLIDQTRIDKSEKLEFSEMDGKKGRKRKSSPEPKHPELVHISSDEENNEEMNAITNNQSPEQPEDDIFETTNHSEHGKDTDDIVQQHESGKESEEQKITAKTTPTEHEDESRSRKKKKRRKQEKSRQTAENHFDMYQRDFLNSSIVVDTVFVGKLKGQATSPVEVTPDRIIISMTSENDVEYVFKLEGRDLTSFVISNESTPLVIILVPTSAWARKIREKYWPIKKDVFIDPGSAGKWIETSQDEVELLT